MHHEEVHIEMLEYNHGINTNNLEVNSAVKYFPYLHEQNIICLSINICLLFANVLPYWDYNGFFTSMPSINTLM